MGEAPGERTRLSYPSVYSSRAPQKRIRYVLTNDNTVTWNNIIRGTASSKLGDYIDHFSIYTENAEP